MIATTLCLLFVGAWLLLLYLHAKQIDKMHRRYIASIDVISACRKYQNAVYDKTDGKIDSREATDKLLVMFQKLDNFYDPANIEKLCK